MNDHLVIVASNSITGCVIRLMINQGKTNELKKGAAKRAPARMQFRRMRMVYGRRGNGELPNEAYAIASTKRARNQRDIVRLPF